MTKKIEYTGDTLSAFEISVYCERNYRWRLTISEEGVFRLTAGCQEWGSFEKALTHYKPRNFRDSHRDVHGKYNKAYYESIRLMAIERLKNMQLIVKTLLVGKKFK